MLSLKCRFCPANVFNHGHCQCWIAVKEKLVQFQLVYDSKFNLPRSSSEAKAFNLLLCFPLWVSPILCNLPLRKAVVTFALWKKSKPKWRSDVHYLCPCYLLYFVASDLIFIIFSKSTFSLLLFVPVFWTELPPDKTWVLEQLLCFLLLRCHNAWRTWASEGRRTVKSERVS